MLPLIKFNQRQEKAKVHLSQVIMISIKIKVNSDDLVFDIRHESIIIRFNN